jgi:hypothetical protein
MSNRSNGLTNVMVTIVIILVVFGIVALMRYLQSCRCIAPPAGNTKCLTTADSSGMIEDVPRRIHRVKSEPLLALDCNSKNSNSTLVLSAKAQDDSVEVTAMISADNEMITYTINNNRSEKLTRAYFFSQDEVVEEIAIGHDAEEIAVGQDVINGMIMNMSEKHVQALRANEMEIALEFGEMVVSGTLVAAQTSGVICRQ